MKHLTTKHPEAMDEFLKLANAIAELTAPSDLELFEIMRTEMQPRQLVKLFELENA